MNPLIYFKKCLVIVICFSGLLLANYSATINEGNQAFAQGQYEQALQLYLQAMQDSSKISPSDAPILHFNTGTCYYRLQQFDKAVTPLRSAAVSGDSSIAPLALYNLANTYYRMGQKEQTPKNKIAQYKEAISMLKRAIDYNPQYENAKRNLEFIQTKLKEELDKHKQEKDPEQKQEKQEPSPQTKEALARALALAKQQLYQDAKSVLEQAVLQDENAAAHLGSYMQRLEDVISILNGNPPSNPVDSAMQQATMEVL
jgi:tetratricopeptide (TPR) repeat protein